MLTFFSPTPTEANSSWDVAIDRGAPALGLVWVPLVPNLLNYVEATVLSPPYD